MDASANPHTAANPQQAAAIIARNLAEQAFFQPIPLQSDHVQNFPYNVFQLTLTQTRSFRQFHVDYAQELSYIARLRNVQPDTYLQDILPALSSLFETLLADLAQRYEPQDLIRVFITHETLTSCNIVIGPEFLRDMNETDIMQQIARVIRSNNYIPADQRLRINVAAVRNLKGSSARCMVDVWKELKRKKSIISIDNDDGLCLPRAIAVAIAHYNHVTNKQDKQCRTIYEAIRKRDHKKTRKKTPNSLQKRTALSYMHQAEIPSTTEGSVMDIPKYEKALQTGITILSACAQNKRIHIGSQHFERQITLYHVTDKHGCGCGHFAVVTSVTGLLGRSYYCAQCDIGYDSRHRHYCKSTCNLCWSKECTAAAKTPTANTQQQQQQPPPTPVFCQTCHAPCRSDVCLTQHKAKELCLKMLFCPNCCVRLKGFGKARERDIKDHQCGEAFCRNCHIYHLDSHLCFMRATACGGGSSKNKQLTTTRTSWRYLFYDFECMQEGESDHIPNLVVCQSICNKCQDVTHVNSSSQCDSCGSRCSSCDQVDKKGKFSSPPCFGCGRREVVFRGSNTAYNFCSWLFSRQHINCIAIAHNAKAYDAYFLYSYLINAAMNPHVIFTGSKIMYCTVQRGLNIKLLDSVNFLPMPLAALPDSFGLPEIKKGFFPHKLNTFNPSQVNFDTLPDASFYDPDNMSSDRRAEFYRWYQENKHRPFDMYQELLDYCRSDVDILLNACWKFRQLMLHITKNAVDPYQYVTIASVAMGTFRTCFLPEDWELLPADQAKSDCSHDALTCKCPWTTVRKSNALEPLPTTTTTVQQQQQQQLEEGGGGGGEIVARRFKSSPIALLPPQGYARRDFFSKQCIQWLHIFEKENPGVSVQSALSPEGEKRVYYCPTLNQKQHYRLDGFYIDHLHRPHALEFNGCYFHGCPHCYPNLRDRTMVGNKTLSRRYQDTLVKERRLRELGFQVHTMWSCEFEQRLSADLRWKYWASQIELQDPLDIRDCYYGGRTNAIVLDKVANAKYFDFVSLYPTEMKKRCYPIGHPQRLAQNIPPPSRVPCYAAAPLTSCPLLGRQCTGWHVQLPYFGVVKARLLPPRQLLHPVLPYRCNGKLMFPLCRTCAEQQHSGFCYCKDEQRSLIGTWCTPEVETALSVGYTLERVYEALVWKDTDDNLFADYINRFLRIKAQASGWPEGVDTDEEKEDYIEDFYRREGIRLVKEEVCKNPGLRTIAKLLLNALYGKFAQRVNMKKCKFVSSQIALYNLLTDSSKNVKDFHILTPNIMLIEYANAKEFQNVDPKTNVVISAFCSTYARLALWKVMHALGDRVLYHDTDSVIFTTTSSPFEWEPPVGECLGDLSDELTCKKLGCPGCETGHWIVEFVACGPKNYAYRLNTGQVISKVRGFSLTFKASQVINFHSMRWALHAWKHRDQEAPKLATISRQFLRDKMAARVYTKQMSKQYNVVYDKRFVLDDFSTLPFGFCTNTPEHINSLHLKH